MKKGKSSLKKYAFTLSAFPYCLNNWDDYCTVVFKTTDASLRSTKLHLFSSSHTQDLGPCVVLFLNRVYNNKSSYTYNNSPMEFNLRSIYSWYIYSIYSLTGNFTNQFTHGYKIKYDMNDQHSAYSMVRVLAKREYGVRVGYIDM